MNQKTTRKYELIAKIATQDTDVMPELTELCGIDFQTAFEMWEFALGRGKDVVLQGFDLFNSTSELKTRQLFCESGPLQKLVYSSPHATNPKLLNFLVQLIMISKIDTADECLQKLRTNNHIDFNDFLRVIIDSTFAASCQKNNTRVPSFNKKQKDLMKDYINKIKGPNKALLLQRMKEL